MKLYDQIKNDIEKLNNSQNSNDLKSLLIRSLSLSRIKNLFNRIDTYYKNDLSIDNLDDLEARLNSIEGSLKNEDLNDIITELNKTKEPDLSFFDMENEEYIQFANMDKAVKDVIEIHYQNIIANDNNPNEVPKELIIAFQREAKTLINKDEYIGLVNVNTNFEYQIIQNFINNPAKEFVNRYKNIFKFNSDNEKNQFIKDVDKEVFVSKAEIEGNALTNDLLNQLEGKGKFAAEDIAEDVIRILNSYYKTRNDLIIDNPNYDQAYPTLGKFLFDVKEKLTEIAIDDDLELATDTSSRFIKAFLDNPISGYIGYLNDINSFNSSLKNMLFEGDISNEELLNRINECKENVLNEEDNLNNASLNKENLWKSHQEYKKDWFMNYFNVELDNKSIDEILEENKGGFFERFFKTTSNEYKEFANALDKVRKDGALNGDLDGLKVLAQSYLSHKLTNYDPFIHGYDDSEIEALDSTAKRRVNLCLSVIDAINSAKEAIEDRLDPKKFTYKELDLPEAHDKYWENNNFYNDLKKDSEIENDKLNEAILDIDPNDLKDDINLDNKK